MSLRKVLHQRRTGVSLIEMLVVVAILFMTFTLQAPALQKVREAAARTQSTNNLKQIVLGFHYFHDANKRLPYNGTPKPYGPNLEFGGEAKGNNFTSGSWAFQILPYIDQSPLFAAGYVPGKTSDAGVAAYICPGRGRPKVCTEGTVGKGPWTDYMINGYVNNPNGGSLTAMDTKRTMVGITDGTSNTIFVGQGSIDTKLYEKATAKDVNGASDTIWSGGSGGLGRNGLTNRQDAPGVAASSWGGPFPRGSLMGMGDGTVRMFGYEKYSGAGDTVKNGVGKGSFVPFLTPNGGETATLPDA